MPSVSDGWREVSEDVVQFLQLVCLLLELSTGKGELGRISLSSSQPAPIFKRLGDSLLLLLRQIVALVSSTVERIEGSQAI